MKRLFFAILLGVLFTRAAQAAVLTVHAPDSGNRIVISLDTGGQSINAVEGYLSFNPSEFSITGISDGGSAVDFWVEQPAFSNASGTVDFAGIIPGGMNTASATIVTLMIAPSASGTSEGFGIVSASALLNDGKGTPATLTAESGPFPMAMTSATATPPSAAITTDAPDIFTPEIATSSYIFNGQYFLSFAATDEGSGIDHYEVLEVGYGGWQVAQSPYLLKDQTLGSTIYVRAVNKAGNFRVVELPAAHPRARATAAPWYRTWIFYAIALCAIVLIGVALRSL